VDVWHLTQIIFLRQAKHLFKKKIKDITAFTFTKYFFLEFGSTIGDDVGVGGDSVNGDGVNVNVFGVDVSAGGDGSAIGGGGEDDCEEVFKPVKDISPSQSN
jgi:hypothetical protein